MTPRMLFLRHVGARRAEHATRVVLGFVTKELFFSPPELRLSDRKTVNACNVNNGQFSEVVFC